MEGLPWRNYPSGGRKRKRYQGPKLTREYVADRVAEYLKNGGKITVLPPQAAVPEFVGKLTDFDWYL